MKQIFSPRLRNLIQLSGLSFIIAASSAFAAGNCVAPPSGLVGWWPAEGSAQDVVGGNNGVISGNLAYWPGGVGLAFVFDGTSASVTVPASPSLSVQSFTIEGWVNPTDVSTQIPVAEYAADTGFAGVHLWLGVGSPGTLFGNIRALSSGLDANILSSAAGLVPSNEWSHVALTFDQASGNAVLYLNGTNVVSQNLGSIVPDTALPLNIGSRPVTSSDGGAGSRFNGQIDELSVYNRALSGSEIQAIYNAGSAGKCVPSGVPVITGFSPTSGTIGTNVTIAGNNFSPVPLNNIVYFGAVRATVVSASLTSLIATVPVGATFAPITVTVHGLTAYADGPFLVTFPSVGTIDSSSLAPRVDLPGGIGAAEVAIGDLDGDGKPDLVFPNVRDGTVWVYRNIITNGVLDAGSFAPRVILTIGGGGGGYSLALADLDGDGRLDIVVANNVSNTVVIFQNLCTPGSIASSSFGPRVDLAVGSNPLGVAVRDLDGDGKPEIVVASYYDSIVSIFQNISSPGNITASSFAARVDLRTGVNPVKVAIADLDGDGKAEVVTVNQGASASTFTVLRNISTAGIISSNSFAPRVDFPGVSVGESVAIGDMDGDGKLDVVIGSSVNGERVSVYRNTSTPGSIDSNSFAPRAEFPAGGRIHTVAIGDLDGDGKPDLALVTEMPSHLSLFHNQSVVGSITTDSFATRVDFPSGLNADGVAFGDLNGDGRPDIAFGNAYDNTVSVYRNIIAGPTQPPFISSQPANRTIYVGASATFTVVAVGGPPLSYQWYFNGSNIIAAATNASLTLTNVQLTDAGNYSVTVTNNYGSIVSSNALLTVNFPPALVRVATTNVVSGGPVSVPITLVANGNENALGFSLNFNSKQLTYVSVTLGSGAAGGTMLLNASQAASGKLGIAVALPTDATFASGTQEVVRVDFTSPVLLGNEPVQSAITFADQPILRQLSDVNGQTLPAQYQSGAVNLSPTDLEGDVSPRPTGNRAATITDWVQLGRFVAGLDTPAAGGEFQRADCAPRASLGDGQIDVTDWVQAGRYAVGLDPLAGVGGPTSQGAPAGAVARSGAQPRDAQSRVINVLNTTAVKGLPASLSVNLQSSGNENALSFSVVFDQTALQYSGISLGSAAAGATLNVNTSQVGSGKLGVALALPTGNSFADGTDNLVKINLLPISSTPGNFPVTFADLPVACGISDPTANKLTASYEAGSVIVYPLPTLDITLSGGNLTLVWPVWAAAFNLQSPGSSSLTGSWTNIVATLQTNGGNVQVTLPLPGQNQFFRLYHP